MHALHNPGDGQSVEPFALHRTVSPQAGNRVARAGTAKRPMKPGCFGAGGWFFPAESL